jgi:hypothetical protein
MSTSYLKANLERFRRRFPEQDLRVSAHPATLGFYTEKSHSGDDILVCLEERGSKRYLQSRVNPRAEAEKNVKESVVLNDSLSVVCVVGFEIGYAVEVLQGNLPATTSILVWEPLKDALLQAFETRCLSGILEDKRIFIHVEDSAAKAAQVFESFLNPVKVRNWSLVVGRGTYQSASNRINDFYKELYSLTTARRLLYETTLNHSQTFIRNAFLNLCRSDQAATVESLRDSGRGRPAIVVSAGPSLTKAIPTLKVVASKCTIVTVGAAWKTLVNEGIRPNYVVLLDPFERTRSEFEGIDPEGETLIADFSGLPDVVSSFKGQIAFYCSSPELQGVMNAVTNRIWGYLQQGGSVAHIALSFAQLIGARPIALIGQDLAFTGGLTHVGTHVDSQQVSGNFSPRHGPLHEVECFGGGGTVLTSRSLDTFRVWFESMSGNEILNATGGGARIRGIKEISFAELTELIHELADLSDSDAELPLSPGLISAKSISVELKSLERRAQRTIMTIDKALELLEQMGTSPPRSQDKLKVQFNNLVRRLSEIEPELSGVLDYIARQQLFQTSRAYNAPSRPSSDDQVRVNIAFYAGLRESCLRALDLFRETRGALTKKRSEPSRPTPSPVTSVSSSQLLQQRQN